MSTMHLLVPLDGSDLSRAALTAVRTAFGPERARLTLLRVASSPPQIPSGHERRTASAAVTIPEPEERAHVYQSQEWDSARQRLRDELETEARRLEKDGWTVAVVAAFGDPAEEIARTAREEKVDLIAMATHGRSGVTRALLGSVAERTLRNASVPVLVVRPERAKERDD